MSQPEREQVEQLQRLLGIPEDDQRPRAGAQPGSPGPGKAGRAAAYAEERRRLEALGYDYGGREQWRRVMRRLGRGR